MQHRSARVLVAILALAAAAPSLADIDAEVSNGDKITSTLSPATESEIFRVRIPQGARVKVKAKAAKKGPALRVVFQYPQAAELSDEGKTATIDAEVSASGLYSVIVTSQDGTTAGDYSLVIAWKSAKTFSKTSTLANAQTDSLVFAADFGASAKLSVKRGKKSQADPALNQVTSPSAGVTPYSGTSATIASTAAGDYVLAFGNPGATQGLVTATVKVKPPKALKRKLLLTSKVVGSGDAAGDAVIAGVVGADGGTVTVPAFGAGHAGAAISGSSVVVPPGSLANGSTLFIATAPDITAPGSLLDAGPTVAFGPEGLKFDAIDKTKKATVKIPYDAAYDSNTSSLVIYTRDAKGKVTEVAKPYTFDKANHTVSFPTSHFSAFQASGPQIVPQFTLNTLVTLNDPRDVCDAHDPASGLKVVHYVAGGTDNTVIGLRKIAPTSANLSVETFVGGGADPSEGTPRLQFQFADPVTSVFATSTGTLFAATTRRIVRLDASGNVHYVAGTGATGDSGDNGPALNATFTSISSILVTPTQQVFVVDAGAHRIRLINGTQITAWAGTGAVAVGVDGADIAGTSFIGPSDIALDGANGLYVADGGRVRHLVPGTGTGVNVTIAGSSSGQTGATGDDGSLLAARFQSLSGITVYPDPFHVGDTVLLVSDIADHTIRRLNLTTDLVELIAGQHGLPGFGGNIDLENGKISGPTQMWTLANDITFVDSFNAKIRVQTPQH